MNSITHNQAWINRQSDSSEARRSYERERLTVWALEEISEAMEQHSLSKADLARMLGTSRANITQALSGARNVTLHTLADLAWACGVRIAVKREPLRDGDFISTPVKLVESVRQIVTMAPDADWDTSCTEDEIELMAGACL
jgi:transcriptional regulator with XRE-family HTH domain